MIEATETYEGLELLKAETIVLLSNNKHVASIKYYSSGRIETNYDVEKFRHIHSNNFSIPKYIHTLADKFFRQNPLVKCLSASNNDKITFVVEPA